MSERKMPTENLGDKMREQYPSNSKFKPEAKQETERLKPVVSTPAVVAKDGLGKKFVKAFFSEDIQDVKRYFIYDLLIPGCKNAILATLNQLFWKNGGGGYFPWGAPQTDYTKAYKQKATTVSYTPSVPQQQNYTRDQNGVKQVIFRTRQDAENVLRALINQVAIYDEVTVLQYYDLCELDSEFTDNKWGWRDVSTTRLYPIRGGYSLQLPPPIPLE